MPPNGGFGTGIDRLGHALHRQRRTIRDVGALCPHLRSLEPKDAAGDEEPNRKDASMNNRVVDGLVAKMTIFSRRAGPPSGRVGDAGSRRKRREERHSDQVGGCQVRLLFCAWFYAAVTVLRRSMNILFKLNPDDEDQSINSPSRAGKAGNRGCLLHRTTMPR